MRSSSLIRPELLSCPDNAAALQSENQEAVEQCNCCCSVFLLLMLQGQAVHIIMASSKIALVSACMGSWWTE
jgi:hypothetical protein